MIVKEKSEILKISTFCKNHFMRSRGLILFREALFCQDTLLENAEGTIKLQRILDDKFSRFVYGCQSKKPKSGLKT
jgi:hypothetical protein